MTASEKKAAQARLANARAQACEVVATGKCPQCGAGLRQNLALTGWWQCKQYGAETHRADAKRPSCSWQAFTA